MIAFAFMGRASASGCRAVFCSLLLLATLATGAFSPASAQSAMTAWDPLEKLNRPVFRVNDAIDHAVIVPAAKTYQSLLPAPVSKGVSNFFANLQEPRCILGGFLRGQPKETFSHSARFLVNSTFGIGGIFDLGADIGVEKCAGGFDLTFQRWGVGEGPYLVLPFMPGKSLRDLAGGTLDVLTAPLAHIQESSLRLSLYVIRLIDQRAQLLGIGIDNFVLESDRYLSVRELYYANRDEETASEHGMEEAEAEDFFSF